MTMRTWPPLSPAMLVLVTLMAHPVFGEEPTESESSVGPGPAQKTPDLNRLLRVPSSTDLGLKRVEERGGKDRAAWGESFSSVRAEIIDLEARIDRTQASLRERAPDDWGFTPTGGGGPPVDPEVLKLRAQLKRDRESLDAARQRQRDLEVEASLAGVPDHWKSRD